MATEISTKSIGEGGRNRLLLITANTGSLFEDMSTLEAGWLREVVEEVKLLQPAFFALHMQEIGGKNYRHCMRLVRGFIQDLQKAFAPHGYTDGSVYLDEELDAEDRFTALGSVYFCHRSFIKRVSQYDFRLNSFQPLSGFEVHSIKHNDDCTVERKRFPKSLFSEVKWSRKGFMRTRWRVDELIFDLVNIHLFHDACNLQAVEQALEMVHKLKKQTGASLPQSPSVYSSHRKNALIYALNELDKITLTKTPMFLFGDFNFRLDTRSLIQSLAPMSDQWPIRDGNGIVKVEYRRPKSTECILSIGTKIFEHENHDTLHCNNLLQFDKELTLYPQLSEWPITFPPSYPYSEDAGSPTMYMKTRAPAWCDRVLMNEAGWELVQTAPSISVSYKTIGQNTCMGDHKPVFLTFSLPFSATGIAQPVNGDSAEVLRPNAVVDWEKWKRLALDLVPRSDRYVRLFENREYQIYSLKIESLEFRVRSPPISRDESSPPKSNDDIDDFVTMITLHDDQTVTVMDASSYGFAFNESWGGSLDEFKSSTRHFEDIDEGDECQESDGADSQQRPLIASRIVAVSDRSSTASGSISRRTSSTFTITTDETSTEEEEEGDSRNIDLSPTRKRAPPPPPPSTPEISKQMRLFDASTDSDLISRRRTISNRYPYYSDFVAVNDSAGEPEAIYAKPASPPVSKLRKSIGTSKSISAKSTSPIPIRKRGVEKSEKAIQVEFNLTYVRQSSSKSISKSKEGQQKQKGDSIGKFTQTDPSITDDENNLENELKRRRRVGLDRWAFDPSWDIVRESITVELAKPAVSIFLESDRKSKSMAVVDRPLCFVQKKPISSGDRKLARRRRNGENGQQRGASCRCF